MAHSSSDGPASTGRTASLYSPQPRVAKVARLPPGCSAARWRTVADPSGCCSSSATTLTPSALQHRSMEDGLIQLASDSSRVETNQDAPMTMFLS